MSNLNLFPYTVTTTRNSRQYGPIHDHVIELDGKRLATASNEDSSWGHYWTNLLNAAYVKGVEDERAQRAAEYVRESFCMEDEEPLPPMTVEAAQLRAANLLIAAYGFSLPIADRLVANGINCPAAFEGVEVEDLTGNCWFTRDEAEDIMSKVNPS